MNHFNDFIYFRVKYRSWNRNFYFIDFDNNHAMQKTIHKS